MIYIPCRYRDSDAYNGKCSELSYERNAISPEPQPSAYYKKYSKFQTGLVILAWCLLWFLVAILVGPRWEWPLIGFDTVAFTLLASFIIAFVEWVESS